FSIGPKWIDLLKQVEPRLAHVAFVFNPETSPESNFLIDAINAAAPSLGVEMTPITVHDRAGIERAIESETHRPHGGLVLPTDNFVCLTRQLTIELAARYRLPAISFDDRFAQGGGLMSYGPVNDQQFRQAAVYIDRILKGARPSDLPIQTPTKFRLVINVK